MQLFPVSPNKTQDFIARMDQYLDQSIKNKETLYKFDFKKDKPLFPDTISEPNDEWKY